MAEKIQFIDANGNPVDVSATNPIPVTGGGGGPTTAVTIANGVDVTQGATGDAAATAGSTGTISAKLRLLTAQINTLLGIIAQLPATLGQLTSANSLSVVIANDQSRIPVANTPTSGKTWQRAQVKLVTANGDVAWITAGTNSLKIRSLILVSDVAQTITIKNAGGSELLGPLYLTANEGIVLPPAASSDEYWAVGAATTGLAVKSTAAANLGGYVTYIDEV